MRHKNIANMNEPQDVDVSDEEGSENDLELKSTSSALKMNRKKSVSLLDFSENDPSLDTSKKLISSDTSCSGSSIWKDSGYNQSESSLSSDKIKQEDKVLVNSKEKILRLQDEVKYKDLIINSLYEINNSLRMKLAKAENKIFELRVKSESHCKCCAYKSPGPSYERFSLGLKPQYKYSVSPIARSEPCLIVQPPTEEEIRQPGIQKSESRVSSPNEDTFNKVKQWQNTYKEDPKRLIRNKVPKVSSQSIEPTKTSFPPEPLPQAMSYMETSRALVETYLKRQEKSPGLPNFQVIGDHLVAVSPIQFVQGCRADEDKDSFLFSNELEKRKRDVLQESTKAPHDHSPVKQSILGNFFFRNQELLRRSTILDTIPLQRFQTRSMNMEYFSDSFKW